MRSANTGDQQKYEYVNFSNTVTPPQCFVTHTITGCESCDLVSKSRPLQSLHISPETDVSQIESVLIINNDGDTRAALCPSQGEATTTAELIVVESQTQQMDKPQSASLPVMTGNTLIGSRARKWNMSQWQ